MNTQSTRKSDSIVLRLATIACFALAIFFGLRAFQPNTSALSAAAADTEGVSASDGRQLQLLDLPAVLQGHSVSRREGAVAESTRNLQRYLVAQVDP